MSALRISSLRGGRGNSTLREQIRYGDRLTVEGNGVPCFINGNIRVRFFDRLPVYLQLSITQIEDPVLRKAVPRIQCLFSIPVELKRGICHLDDENC